MKRLTVLITILLLAAVQMAVAQTDFKVRQVRWRADNTIIGHETAFKRGTTSPQRLTFDIYLDESAVPESMQGQTVRFEFQWSYYGATQKYLMDSQVRNYTIGGESRRLSSSMTNLKPGWWEVKVLSHSNKRQALTYKQKQQFRIYLR